MVVPGTTFLPGNILVFFSKNSTRPHSYTHLGGISLREKVVASSYLFKTWVLPLQMVPAIAAISFLVAIEVNMLVRHPESLQQTGLTIVALGFTIFWGSLLCLGLINLPFNKMIIEEDGITFQGLRIFKYTRFPMYLSFDEIRIKPVWGGRILVFASGEEMKRIRRILLFGGIWVMPFRWKECIEVIKNFKPSSVTRA